MLSTKTKSELITMYDEGRLFDSAYYSDSAFSGYMIIACDDEAAFGYYAYDNKKTFFLRKVYYTNDEYGLAYIKQGNNRLYLGDFIKIFK